MVQHVAVLLAIEDGSVQHSGVALLVLAAWGAVLHPAAQAGTGAAQGSICSVAELIKAALTLIISPVPDFLSRFYKLPFEGEPSLSCYHLRA